MEEIWKDISEYEGYYQISSFGRVKSLSREDSLGRITLERILCPRKKPNGYLYVTLCKNSHQKNKYIHRLVAESFNPNKLQNLEINHIDGNKLNNNINNLEWISHRENQIHAYKSGLNKTGENHHLSKLTNKEVLEIRKIYSSENISQKELGKRYGVGQSRIGRIINRAEWKHI